MKDQRLHPGDFIPVSPSRYADATGLRGSIVHELIKRKEVQHFIDVQGRIRVWLDISRWCKHTEEPIDWGSGWIQDTPSINLHEGNARSDG
jgi:hypothetical protein